jgi:hypothetical protein
LKGVDLAKANLSEVNLMGFFLRGTNLRGANLRDTNLRGAYLLDTNLTGANLDGVNWSGAKGISATQLSHWSRPMIGWQSNPDDLNIYSGCRQFHSISEAVRHWTAWDYPDKERGFKRVKEVELHCLDWGLLDKFNEAMEVVNANINPSR